MLEGMVCAVFFSVFSVFSILKKNDAMLRRQRSEILRWEKNEKMLKM